MSNRNYDIGYCIGKGKCDLTGSFVPLTGAGTIVAANVTGFGFGFAPSAITGVVVARPQPQNNPTPLSTPGILRTGVGIYVVTLEDPYLGCDFFGCDLAAPAGGSALWAQPVEPVINLNVANTGPSFSILIVNSAGTPTDAAANMRLYFSMTVRNSNVQFRKP